MKKIDMLHREFNRLKVIEFDRQNGNKFYWKCQCECGNIVSVEGSKLRNGHTKSCGCLREEIRHRQRKENEYSVVDGYAKVKLNENTFMLCDIEDWERLKNHHWHLNAVGYAASGTTDKSMLFHKEVTGTKSEIIDHINRNKLDNRKENLRIADKRINTINRELQPNNTTGHKGVYLDKRYNTWFARITVLGETIHLGTYKTKEEAIRARIEGEEKYYIPLIEA